jgi:hypothetical protein
MSDVDFKDLKTVPKVIRQTVYMVASNAAHLAASLKRAPYPGIEESD